MPYARPTLTALRNQAVQDITTSGVPGLDGLLRNAVLRVLAWCMSGLAYSLYGYLDWIAHEAVPFTATDEYLEAWAALIGIHRKDSTPATGQAQFTGQPNVTIPNDTPLLRQDGTPYATTADAVTDANGNVTVPIVASVNGALTDCDAGTPIAIAAPVPGINSGGVMAGPATGGADQETDDDLRTRMLAKYAAPSQGGAITDYEQWALEVPGVTRVWVIPNGMGAGTVVVQPMFDDAEAANGGFPQGTNGVASAETRAAQATGDQLAVADYIYPLQPVTALVYVVAPVPFPVNITLAELSPNTPEIVTEITASLTDAFRASSEIGGIVYPSQLYEAILATPGVVHFSMTNPSDIVDVPAGGLPILGSLTVAS